LAGGAGVDLAGGAGIDLAGGAGADLARADLGVVLEQSLLEQTLVVVVVVLEQSLLEHLKWPLHSYPC
jgi:hypothetical protein